MLIISGKLTKRHNRQAIAEHKEKFNDSEIKLIQGIESLFKKQLLPPPKIEKTKVSQADVQKIIKILMEQ